MLWALEEKPGKGWDKQGQFCISGDDPTAPQTGACSRGGAGRGKEEDRLLPVKVPWLGGLLRPLQAGWRLIMLQLIGHVRHGHGRGLEAPPGIPISLF